MAILPKGAEAPLSGHHVEVVLEWTESGGATHDIDVCALLLRDQGKVKDNGDFVFYNQPHHPSSAVIHRGRVGTTDRLGIDVSKLPDDTDTVILVGSITGGPLGAVGGLAAAVRDLVGGGEDLRFDDFGVSHQTAFVIGELRRRDGHWTFCAVGRAWDSGLAGLVEAYGVAIDTPESSAPSLTDQGAPHHVGPESAPAPPAAATPRRPSAGYRRPLPRVWTAPGTPTLDGGYVTLPIGGAISLLQQGRTPQALWLRVTHTGADGAVRADLSVLAYDDYGTPGFVVDHSVPTDGASTIRLISKPTTPARDNTAAVELRLSSVDDAIASLIVAITSYDGKPLTPNGAFVTELVAMDGTVLASTQTPAPNTTGVLLLTVKRDPSGSWVLTPHATAAAGRVARSLVGAGRWALSA